MWLFLEKDNTVAAIEKYADERGSIYAFDSTVSRCSEVRIGDTCIYRLNDHIHFLGKIISISQDQSVKQIKKCPSCGRKNSLRKREKKHPPFKCGNCTKTFSEDLITKNTFDETVTRYKANYDSIDISNYKIPFRDVKSLIITKDGRPSPKNQGSIAELNSNGMIALLEAMCGDYVTEYLDSSQASINQKNEETRFNRPPRERRKNAYEQNRAVEERAYEVAESYFNSNNLDFKWVGDDRGSENKHCDYQVFNQKGQLIKNVEVKGLKGAPDKLTGEISLSLSKHEYELALGAQHDKMMAIIIVHSIKLDRYGNEYKGRDGTLLINWN